MKKFIVFAALLLISSATKSYAAACERVDLAASKKVRFAVHTIYKRCFLVESKPDCTLQEFKQFIRHSLSNRFPENDFSSIKIDVSKGAVPLIDDSIKISDYGVNVSSLPSFESTLIISLTHPKKGYIGRDLKNEVPFRRSELIKTLPIYSVIKDMLDRPLKDRHGLGYLKS